MSNPPIYATLRASSAVTALLGSHPNLRVYAFGQAPQGVTRPYIVWQMITGSPENNLSQRPDFDSSTIQVDIYALTAQSAEAVRLAARDAIEPVTHITSWGGESRDPATNDYRITFSVDWFVRR